MAKRIGSILLCAVLMLSVCSYISLATVSGETAVDSLDYESLFEEGYVINNGWDAADLQSGNTLEWDFRGRQRSEVYDPGRHFADFDAAYAYYLEQHPDILSDLPVFIFAPGVYDSLITVRYSALILGANAGIDPNAEQEWTLNAMAQGVPANLQRTQETVFTAGLTRTTCSPGEAKWAYDLEQKEQQAGEKADLKLIVDGVKLTGTVGISQYDYSNRLYTDLTLNSQPIEFTPTGTRSTLTALVNAVVENFSGTAEQALFAAPGEDRNKNDVLMSRVRLTGIQSEAAYLFYKYFRNLTIDGMYYANNGVSLFGKSVDGSAFCGSSSVKTAEYDQDIEIKNSVFYQNASIHPLAMGNETGGNGHTKMTANIHHNFFYDAVYLQEVKDYWGVFLVNSYKSGVEYTVNVTDNIFHQQNTTLKTLFNGNGNYQRSKTVINFHRNKVTGKIGSIYPNNNWGSSSFLKSSLFYDFSYNFHAASPEDIATRPEWTRPPKSQLASGYDYKTAPYYLDYQLQVPSNRFELQEVSGLGDQVQIDGYYVTADCSTMSGVLTPVITTKSGTPVEIFRDAACTAPITTIDLSAVGKEADYYIKLTSGEHIAVGILKIITGKYVGLETVSQIDPAKFNLPVISINTEGGAPIVDKENYVTCGVTISNADDDDCMTDVLAGIRYRGNSTLVNADKKPYRIKFDKKQNLFGMGKAKSWVLLANAFDKTMVRNAVAFAVGAELGLDYTSQFQFVNLYLNGAYQGMYLLGEQTQTGSTRVDIEEDEEGKVDTGYLIELTGNGDPDEDRDFAINEVPAEDFGAGVTENWRSKIKGYLKTPEMEVCTDQQVAFISDYVNQVNHAILTQDWASFNTLCDVDSFAKYFIANTVMNNADAGYQIYTYKKENGGKLYAGPLWDFDQSAASNTHCGDDYDKWYTGTVNPWFDSLSHWPEFLKLAKGIYWEHHDAVQEIVAYYTTAFYGENTYDYHANDVLWNSVEDDYWRISDTVKNLTSYSANFNHLNTWFKNRIAWMDEAYNVVTILPSAITLDKANHLMQMGEQYSFAVEAQPAYTDAYTVEWSSSAPQVVSVEKGVITAHRDGTAIITASVQGTNAVATCNVLVCTAHHNNLLYNEVQHYHQCSICQKETDFEPHTFDNTCDATCPCGYVRAVPAHQYDNSCDPNCNNCGAPRTVRHQYDHDCDTQCNVCFAARVTAHKFGEYVYNNDATEQKDGTKTRTCSVCGHKETIAAPGTRLEKTLIDSSKRFKDVPSGKWYKKYVDYAVTYEIFSGTGSDTFSPDLVMSRAQFVQVFANLSGVDTSNPNVESGFSDVPKGAWYTAAVTWAAQNGIVSGVGNGRFDPNAQVTREQMCVMLANYMENFLGVSLQNKANVEAFADDREISSWAKASVYKCANAALVNGVGNNRFAPKASATRAEGATLFTTFHREYMN